MIPERMREKFTRTLDREINEGKLVLFSSFPAGEK